LDTNSLKDGPFKSDLMKIPAVILLTIFASSFFSQKATAQTGYEPSAENLRNRDWFQDNKYGLFVHWGVYSVMAGGGDMEEWLIEKSAEMGLGKNVLFAGFLRGKDIDKAYRMADLYVMPSVSEPFGITPLEAMRNKTPCIISKTSGVSEVLKHAFKVDFWDIDKMSNMIITGLNYKTMYNMISENASNEVFQHNWSSAAEKCLSVYRNVLES